ncbi:MAG: hypothetical protein JXM71_03015 [Spirochaetales bacterium]|nr:hypothetical protein [Spirochaetales bacterium]
MKKAGLVAMMLAAALATSGAADLYEPDRPLYFVDTEFFTIIFPDESREAAEYLATFADDSYREIAAALATEATHRFPVVITPDFGILNGYYSSYPYPRIVLYQAPAEPSSTLGSFKDDLRAVFRHELTHAVSLSLRSPLEDAVVSVFGSPFGLSGYLTPMTFVEGVTVSFESLDGTGRTDDPLTAAIIRQDLLEGTRRTFEETSGAWDLYPGADLYYIYGGYFSRYLQERWGMELYAELWRSFGVRSLFRGLDDFLWAEGHMTKVYGVSLSEAWDDFLESMELSVPVYTSVKKLTPPSLVTALAARSGTVYYADRAREAVFAYDTATGIESQLFRSALPISRLDVAPDGSSILVSTMRYEGGLPRLELREWKASTNHAIALPHESIRDAAYAREPGADAVVGIRVNGYTTELVMIAGDETRVLLRGSERVSYSSPVATADGSIVYALAREDGVSSVIRLSLASGTGTMSLDASTPSVSRLVLPAGLSAIRYLSVDDAGVLRFSWDDVSFYRLAELDGEELSYQCVPLSGGVHLPVHAANRVYYIGRFGDGAALCALPQSRDVLGFETASVRWVDAMDLTTIDSAYGASPAIESRRYSPARWLLPRFWYPVAVAEQDALVSAGVFAVFADPAERFEATVNAGYNVAAGAADLALSATWSRFPADISFELYDEFTSPGTDRLSRSTGAYLGVGDSYPMTSGATISWSAKAAIRGYAEVPTGSSPYASWSSASVAAEAAASLGDTRSPLGDAEARAGYEATILARLDAPVPGAYTDTVLGLEPGLALYAEAGALALETRGALAPWDGLSYGPRGRLYASGGTTSAAYPNWPEFSGGDSGPWLAEASASARLLALELHRQAWALYANRVSVRSGLRGYATGDSRSSFIPKDSGWSMFGRATLTWTPNVGAFATLHPSSYVEVWYRPDFDAATADAYGVSYALVASY